MEPIAEATIAKIIKNVVVKQFMCPVDVVVPRDAWIGPPRIVSGVHVWVSDSEMIDIIVNAAPGDYPHIASVHAGAE